MHLPYLLNLVANAVPVPYHQIKPMMMMMMMIGVAKSRLAMLRILTHLVLADTEPPFAHGRDRDRLCPGVAVAQFFSFFLGCIYTGPV